MNIKKQKTDTEVIQTEQNMLLVSQIIGSFPAN